MVILLTNDDGIRSYGIRDLSKILSQEHEIYVVAPERERSAASHSLTLHKPLRAKEVEINGAKGAWETNGTPSDCVKLAIYALLPRKPDLLISGINRGANLGTDVLYSGTVAAAMEGAFLGIPSIAVSHVSFERKKDYIKSSNLILKFINIVEKILEPGVIFNVNIPDCLENEIKGFKLVSLQLRNYKNLIETRVDPKGEKYYWLYGVPDETISDFDSDIGAIKKNYISITPLHWDLTNLTLLERIKKMNIF
ncbi:5'-nucleotidase /3'-nucleotidase /exopolyphosphatase [Thermodesulfobium acidiphilum]|uniref:5'-nucleotidase SurE n=1 Tax=Thermodesulfobium acidiphilum TaxID=1794699 RepID=A0A2R4W1J5_THEAF|nr:5'/3'-nucleotidase SurE [Thermodesulfobium acidiphilum]AWB10570.1 5'-nucleotidase /3'-nucleotidase /exopolyphosphatase [Thermodesulfobium acidiphilum]